MAKNNTFLILITVFYDPFLMAAGTIPFICTLFLFNLFGKGKICHKIHTNIILLIPTKHLIPPPPQPGNLFALLFLRKCLSVKNYYSIRFGACRKEIERSTLFFFHHLGLCTLVLIIKITGPSSLSLKDKSVYNF